MTTARTMPRTRKPTVRPDSRVVPFVIQREGEEAAPDNLRLTPLGGGRYRLGYADEDPATATSVACCGPAAASARSMTRSSRQAGRNGG